MDTSTSVGDIGAISAAAAEVAARVRASVAEVRAPGAGAGAGTIWRADGIIVTNHHVAPRDRAEVALSGGQTLAASVVARDPANDLAVLKVPAEDLPAATIGDARALRVGELVLAVGHPFGIRGALTIGVVSSAPVPAGPGRPRELLRADLLLGPGNSGGPLVDAHGRVVGINSMVVGGLALAVPSHVAERLVAYSGGQPVLGLVVRDVALSPALAESGQLGDGRAGGLAGRGVLVVRVAAGGAAARAGLLPGDVLATLNGYPLDSADDLVRALAAHPRGGVRLGLLREGAVREVTLVPGQAEYR